MLNVINQIFDFTIIGNVSISSYKNIIQTNSNKLNYITVQYQNMYTHNFRYIGNRYRQATTIKLYYINQILRFS